jgi:hypothetical protein
MSLLKKPWSQLAARVKDISITTIIITITINYFINCSKFLAGNDRYFLEKTALSAFAASLLVRFWVWASCLSIIELFRYPIIVRQVRMPTTK